MAYTSIQISPKTKEKLASLKGSSRQTYDDVLSMLLELVPEGDEEGNYTSDFRAGLLRAKIQIARGQTISHERLMKKLGL